MRVCDKCRTGIVTNILADKKDGTEFDFCGNCYGILRDWMTNPERKKEDDPVEVVSKPAKRR